MKSNIFSFNLNINIYVFGLSKRDFVVWLRCDCGMIAIAWTLMLYHKHDVYTHNTQLSSKKNQV